VKTRIMFVAVLLGATLLALMLAEGPIWPGG
jgi:hypothetical protein